MNILIKFVMVGLVALSFSACNTISGAGKDIKAGGAAIENTAEDAKK